MYTVCFGKTEIVICQSDLGYVHTVHRRPIPYPLDHQTKIAADDILIFYIYLSKKIRLEFSCESSAEQRRGFT